MPCLFYFKVLYLFYLGKQAISLELLGAVFLSKKASCELLLGYRRLTRSFFFFSSVNNGGCLSRGPCSCYMVEVCVQHSCCFGFPESWSFPDTAVKHQGASQMQFFKVHTREAVWTDTTKSRIIPINEPFELNLEKLIFLEGECGSGNRSKLCFSCSSTMCLICASYQGLQRWQSC